MSYSSKINDAIRVSAMAHEGQYRKGARIPYVTHCFAVALITERYTNDEDVFVAALLHDILEDVPTNIYSRKDMLRDFGADILGIVDDVTEPDILEPTEKAWLERKQSYIDHLYDIYDMRPLIVATADKIHNMSEIIREHAIQGGDIWKAFHAERNREIWFYESVLAVLEAKVIPAAAIEDYQNTLKELKKPH